MLDRICLAALCACLFFPADAGAQLRPRYDDARVVRVLYGNASGEQGTTTLHYRRDGALATEFWTLDDGRRFSANFYALDDRGLPVEKRRAFSDSLTSIETFTYDTAGRRGAETFARSDGKTGSATYRRSADGRLLSADCDNYKGWLTCRIEYEYEDDRPSGAALIRDGRPAGAISYEYDGTGYLASETWDFDGRWSQTFTYEYEPVPARVYDSSNPLTSCNPRFRVEAENYDFDGKGGGPSHYEYDADGRLLKKIFERSDGLRTETTYEFDERGNLVSSHRAYHDDRTADFTYEYDGALRLIAKNFRRSDGAEGFEKYTYDRFGRLALASYRNMDFWLNGAIAFDYDERGHLAGGRFTAEDENSADLVMTTDGDGNVTKVKWRFDRGFTQTYDFEYAPAASTTGGD